MTKLRTFPSCSVIKNRRHSCQLIKFSVITEAVSFTGFPARLVGAEVIEQSRTKIKGDRLSAALRNKADFMLTRSKEAVELISIKNSRYIELLNRKADVCRATIKLSHLNAKNPLSKAFQPSLGIIATNPPAE